MVATVFTVIGASAGVGGLIVGLLQLRAMRKSTTATTTTAARHKAPGSRGPLTDLVHWLEITLVSGTNTLLVFAGIRVWLDVRNGWPILGALAVGAFLIFVCIKQLRNTTRLLSVGNAHLEYELRIDYRTYVVNLVLVSWGMLSSIGILTSPLIAGL